MNLEIITFHIYNNYGAVLQEYALQVTFEPIWKCGVFELRA